MNNIASVKAKNKEDALKYAYAFMKCEVLNIKECSFFNQNPSEYDNEFLMPRDLYSVSYREENLPIWNSFKTNKKHIESPAFTCVASIDKNDKNRVLMGMINDIVFFSCYGNYETDAKKAFENICFLYNNL